MLFYICMDNNVNLKVLKSPLFLDELVRRTEISCSKSFWRFCDGKHTLRYIINQAADSTSRSIISNRISVKVGEEFEQEFKPTLKSFGLSCKHIDNSTADFLINNVLWELKTSKHSKKSYSLQGSTHSNLLCENYIFIRYELDLDTVIKYKSKPNNIIKGIHFSVHNGIVKKEYWIGEATNNNSRTVLKVPNSKLSLFQKGLIYGEVIPAKKYLQFKTIPFKLYEIQHNNTILSNIIR